MSANTTAPGTCRPGSFTVSKAVVADVTAPGVIPERLAGSSFADFVPRTDSQANALRIAREFVAEYPTVERGLMLTGPAGSGKTHLCVALARGLAAKGASCIYFDQNELLASSRRANRQRAAADDLLRLTTEADLLVLDGLGAGRETEWGQDVIAHIIGRRYNTCGLTVVASRFSDFAAGPTAPTLTDLVGARVRSRLFEMCRELAVCGPAHAARSVGSQAP